MYEDDASAHSFADFALELARQPDLDSTLQLVGRRTVDSIPGADDAAITVRQGGRYRTVGATSDLPMRVDAIQYRLNEGPCLQVLDHEHVLRSDDLATDPRWPTFGRAAVDETEVMSMMSHRLLIEDDLVFGALNIYSRKPAAFAAINLSALDELATHSAIALTLATARADNEHLRRGLESNRTIGVAIGILMATRLVTRDQSFDLLRVASQHSHRKLIDVAGFVIETGTLPDIRNNPAGHLRP